MSHTDERNKLDLSNISQLMQCLSKKTLTCFHQDTNFTGASLFHAKTFPRSHRQANQSFISYQLEFLYSRCQKPKTFQIQPFKSQIYFPQPPAAGLGDTYPNWVGTAGSPVCPITGKPGGARSRRSPQRTETWMRWKSCGRNSTSLSTFASRHRTRSKLFGCRVLKIRQ